MTTDCLWELQKAVFATLDGDVTLSGLANGVYSHVPQDTVFPYIKFNDIKAQDWSTLAKKGIKSELSLSVFSRERGSKEALEMLIEIKRLLDGSTLSMAGCSMVNMAHNSHYVRQLSDGVTWVGQIEFVAFVSED